MTALVPVRVAPIAKRRLAHALPSGGRTGFILETFDHVVDVLQGAGLRVVALSPHPIDRDIEVWTDEVSGLNRIVDAGIARSGMPVLIAHADLPRLSVEGVLAVLESPGDVVIARARDGGTNLLLLRAFMRAQFGPRSALRHATRARSTGLRARVIDREDLALDVDDVASLTASSSRLPS